MKDLTSIDEIRAAIDEMARDNAAWLEKKSLLCRTVTIKVRYADFVTITRSHSESPPTRDPDGIAARACALLDRTEAGRRPVRLLGASVHNLIDPSKPGDDAEDWDDVREDGAAALPFVNPDEDAG